MSYRSTAERKAIEDGLQFTGIYANSYKENADEPKQRAAEIRKLGFRARLIVYPEGKSVYADKAYFEWRKKNEGY